MCFTLRIFARSIATKSRAWVVVIASVALSFPMLACAQENSWQQSVVKVRAGSTQPGESEQGWREVMALPSDQKRQALAELVQTPESHVASKAARAMIAGRIGGADEVIAAQISEWDASVQTSLLQSIILSGNASEHLQTARKVLSHAFAAGQSGPDAFDHPINTAASILSRSALSDDRTLLKNLVQMRPQFPNLWLAIAQGQLESSVIALGTLTYTNASQPENVRVAAAVALASEVPAALEYAMPHMMQIMDDLGGIQMKEIVLGATSGDSVAKQRAHEFDAKCRMVAMVQYLPDMPARQLVERGLNAKNETIRMISAMVAVDRFADLVVMLPQSTFSNSEFLNLLAFLVLRHPGLRATVEQRIPAAELTEAEHQLTDHGPIVVFGTAGTALNGL